ncbi:MAG TPA: class I SAM-dependent methyltransferase [Fimbriimonadaceae bacterium]|nr:class I SAM-dependent methyltransferase [Fimbriimonadaceae bacterium]
MRLLSHQPGREAEFDRGIDSPDYVAPTPRGLGAAAGRLLATDLLDVRNRDAFLANPTACAANIPLSELPQCPFELPPPGGVVRIADTGAEAHEALVVLQNSSRSASLVPTVAGRPTGGDRFRLWGVSSHLSEGEAAAPARALCLACGTGREAVVLAAAGWEVTAIDMLADAIERGKLLEQRYVPPGKAPIRWLPADLRKTLPDEIGEFELISQFFFADRSTPDRVARHLACGGVALLEAFSEEHWRERGRPSASRVLRSDTWPAEFSVRFAEGYHEGRHTTRMKVQRP